MPLLALLVYIIGTYFPLIYTFFPLLGALKIVLVAGIVLMISFISNPRRYGNATAYQNPIVYCWIGFLLLMMFGLIISLDRGMTLLIFTANLKVFLVFLVMIKIVDSTEKLERIVFV